MLTPVGSEPESAAVELEEPAGVAMQRQVVPDFTSTAIFVHVSDVVQLTHAVVPRTRPRRRPQRWGFAALSPSVLAIIYVELADVIYQLDTMLSPSQRSSADTVGMAAAYAIGGVDVGLPPRPPLPHFARSVSSLVLFRH